VLRFRRMRRFSACTPRTYSCDLANFPQEAGEPKIQDFTNQLYFPAAVRYPQ
jgi:hypothetical protein